VRNHPTRKQPLPFPPALCLPNHCTTSILCDKDEYMSARCLLSPRRQAIAATRNITAGYYCTGSTTTALARSSVGRHARTRTASGSVMRFICRKHGGSSRFALEMGHVSDTRGVNQGHQGRYRKIQMIANVTSERESTSPASRAAGSH
jgi:hypothetical protein